MFRFSAASFRWGNDVVDYDSFPLHKAIVENNTEGLELLLRSSSIDINLQDEQGQTPLFLSLKRERSNSFIMQLIQAGCDVNIPDTAKVTPLHLAVSLPLNDIAHELIKRGANVNAQEEHTWIRGCVWVPSRFEEESFNKKTPLHHAVQHNNLEGVCMLLYYCADVYVMGSNNMTPLKYAACKKLDEIVKILINYYHESYYMYGPIKDHFSYQPYRLNLEHEGTILLIYSLFCRNQEHFKLFWKKINFKNILNNRDSNILLIIFIKYFRFSASDWLKYLYPILNIFVTRSFSISYTNYIYHWNTESFFYFVFKAFLELNIGSADRLVIMNVCLSLGAPIHINDFKEVHKHYGFNEELESLIYANSYYKTVDETPLPSISSFILAMERSSDYKLLGDVFKSYFLESFISNDGCYRLCVPTDYFVSLLGFFSLSAEVKQEINNLHHGCPEIPKKLEQIPEFPSLLELSRNMVRKYIKQSNNIKYPYQFHDAVKKLNLPKLITDIIRFKVPLYLTD